MNLPGSQSIRHHVHSQDVVVEPGFFFYSLKHQDFLPKILHDSLAETTLLSLPTQELREHCKKGGGIIYLYKYLWWGDRTSVTVRANMMNWWRYRINSDITRRGIMNRGFLQPNKNMVEPYPPPALLASTHPKAAIPRRHSICIHRIGQGDVKQRSFHQPEFKLFFEKCRFLNALTPTSWWQNDVKSIVLIWHHPPMTPLGPLGLGAALQTCNNLKLLGVIFGNISSIHPGSSG